ncbi:hypothetical protein [Georgenia satyanarayanai]|uniref:hypothetical protein n=1 Tax=Georgenia satyanarayanai TaxID=860221 RepID=UPI0011B7E85F|nr:hypothetical protein [Georgenia satyanarayanai]
MIVLSGCTSSSDAEDDRIPTTVECVLSYRADAGDAASEEQDTVEVERVSGPEGTTGSVTFREGTPEELTFEVTYRSTTSDAQVWTTVSGEDDLVRQYITEFGESTNLHIDPYGEEGFTGIEETTHRGALLRHYCQGAA